MPTTNLSKGYTFKNSGEKENNDIIYPELFELANKSYSFSVRPKSKIWRLGIRLSKSPEFEFYDTPPRHRNLNFPDIHIGAGMPISDKWDWGRTEEFHLVNYYLQDVHDFSRQYTYKELGNVEWKLVYDEGPSILNLSYTAEGCKPYSTNLTINKDYKYFKLFAWADKIDYEIECTIQVTTVGKDLSDNNLLPDHFWFLKLSPESWIVENFRVGSIEEFSTHKYNLTEPNTIVSKRPEYELYFKVNEGDKVIGYAYQNHDAVVCLFDVVSPVHINKADREIISIKVSKVLEPKIPIELFRNKITFENELNATSQIRLIEITKAIYDAILNSNDVTALNTQIIDPITIDFKRYNLSNIDTDNASVEIKDDLGFKADVNALASIIAYKEVNPPLAIGLFGNWGSGKSFFMNKLQKRISELSNEEEVFCKEIVHINFNSWHYSDSNLWASLITKIFDELEKYGKKDILRLEKLFENLNSTKELLKDTEQQKENVQKEIDSLLVRQRQINEEINQNAKNLKNLSTLDIIKAMWQSDFVVKKRLEVEKKYEFLDLKEYDQIIDNVNTLNTTAGRLWKSVKLISSFRAGKLWKALLIFILVAAISYFLIEWSGFFENQFEAFKLFVVAFAAWSSQLITYLKPVIKRINGAYYNLLELKKITDQIEARERDKNTVQKQELQTKLGAAQNSQDELRQRLEDLKSKRTVLQLEIDEITSGRKIVRFIESRVTDVRYINSLGIISWIRKDFEELDFLLKQQYDATELAKRAREKVENVFEINRIILYIDDLDRCDVSIVIKVLEAIHLLLAFPLFVVVVGVDPRWMNNALTIKYKDFLQTRLKGQDNTNSNGTNSDSNISALYELMDDEEAATSYDYLEKIFQIPFVLKKMDKPGKSELIKSQFTKKKNYAGPKKEGDAQDISTGDTNQNIANSSNEANDTGSNKEATHLETASTSEKEKNQEQPPQDYSDKDNVNSELLNVSENEIALMQAIGFLIGKSPRTIKRYTNIYRIIRIHSEFKFGDNSEEEHYFAAVLLLGVITGIPNIATKFFEKLRTESKYTVFKNFIQENLSSEFGNAPELSEILNEMEKTGEEQKLFHKLGSIKLDKFQQNLELISRFSFRHLTK